MHEALAKGNRNSHAVGWAVRSGCAVISALTLAAVPAWADRPDQSTTDSAVVGTSPQADSTVASPAPARKVDRLLELVVVYLDHAFDAGRRAHRDAPRDEVPERIADGKGQ